MSQKSGLGMGLSSLIPNKKTNENIKTEKAKNIEDKILEIDIDKISANPYQPRKKFDQDALENLASSIKEQGILQPLLVTDKGMGEYELVAGERRLRASKLAGLKKVPVILKEFSEKKKIEVALVENIQRENLNLIEEAKVYQQLKDDYDLTLDETAETVGKSRETISSALRIFDLPAEVQRLIADGKISKMQAGLILKLKNIEEQILLAKKIANDGLSGKETEIIVEKKLNTLNPNKKISVKNIDSRLSKIEEELANALKTKVKISGRAGKGKIVIEYYSEEELNSFCKKLETTN